MFATASGQCGEAACDHFVDRNFQALHNIVTIHRIIAIGLGIRALALDFLALVPTLSLDHSQNH
jgi:hypothetical protein